MHVPEPNHEPVQVTGVRWAQTGHRGLQWHSTRAGSFVSRPLPAMDVCGDDPSEKDLCLNTNCFCVTEVFNKKHFAL